MTNTQQIFDNIPTPIKSILIRSLYISIRALKEDLKEIKELGIEDDISALIESMQFIESKLTNKDPKK